jgi:peroxiredoxin (alkyl hydroperoxide reductase subunit C)
MALINTAIQPFSAHAYRDGEFVEITDAQVKGRWSVFFFYPADFTFVCPTELGDLADHYEAFQAASETIKRVKYAMIGDPTGRLTRAFDVMMEGEGLAMRGTFVVNPEGVIKAMEVHDDGIGRDAKELLRKVQAAQYVAAHPGEACPARWAPGAKTLTPSIELVGKI